MAQTGNGAALLIDVSRLVWRRWTGTRATGIDRICLAWLAHYAPQSQAVIIHRHAKAILPEHISQTLFRLLLQPERNKRDNTLFRSKLIALGLRHAGHLRDRLPGRGRVWLNPGHTGLDVPDLAQWCQGRDLRPVYLVHDLIPITHPAFCRDGEQQRHRRRMQTVLATASGVVANSGHTLDSLADFARSQGAALAPAAVAWPGTSFMPSAPARTDRDPTFVILGTIEGRKNHMLLLSVWLELLTRKRDAPTTIDVPRLVIVGRRGWKADDVFALLDHHDFGDRVSEVGALDDGGLANALRDARALLFPSLAEGFGIPLVEALAAGVPVIASDLPVFREIGQGVPLLLPANDRDAWCRAVLEFARPVSVGRTQQFERLSQFRPPSWDEHFTQVDQLLAAIGAQ